MFKVIVFTVILLFFSVSLFCQFATIETFGTKSIGVGSCISSLKDINSVYGNVAGLANTARFDGNISYENRFQAFDLSVICFGIAKKFNKAGVFGISVKKFGISEYNEFQAGINYARKLTNSLSLGVRFNVYNLLIEEYGNRFGYNTDAGLQYDLNEKLSLGFYLINPFPVKFIDETKLPTLVFLGLNYNASENLNLYCEVEKHLDHDFFVKAGVEFRFMEKFSLYGGFRNDLDKFSDFSAGFRYGISSETDLNICTQYNTTLGLSPSIGVSYAMK